MEKKTPEQDNAKKNKAYPTEMTPLDFIKRIKELEKQVFDLKALHVQQLSDAWVDVSERLPEQIENTSISEDVICLVLSRETISRIQGYYDFSHKQWCLYGGDPENFVCIKWHPMPNLPTSLK